MIADATVMSLMPKVTQGSAYLMRVLAMMLDAGILMNFVPSDFEFKMGSLTFDSEEHTALS